jgi:PAS domain S-box-containing protein
LEFVHPEDVQSTLNEIEKLSQGLLTISFTNRYRCKDGTYRWLEWNSAPAGESIFAIARDITERIENENKLKESLSETSQYKYALDQSAIVSITTIDGIVTYVNDNFCKISQFKKEEILNRNLREINPGYFAQNEFDEMYPVITAGKIWHGELKNKAKDGSFYWVDTIIVPFMDDNDKPFQFLGIRHDITERKKAEFELLELKQNLENKVIERTHQLESSNQDLEKEKIKSDELLLNILPQTVASELKSSGVFSPSYMNSVTVVFTDFLNFTQISENLSPHEVVSLINHYYVAFDNLTSKYGLEKIKTIGDSYMCAGGLPVENNSHAEDAVRFAIEICQFVTNEKIKLEALGKPYFEMRIGLNSGPVVAGIVGVKKYAYDIWGDTVNIAARMETSGEAGKVNISGSTYALVKDNFHCIYRGKIEAKNKGVIDMYYVNL